MKRIADIAVFSPDGSLKLIVEVKNYRKATDAWAAKLRGNLMADGFIPASEFFLLILPEFSYLWRRSESPDAVPADYKTCYSFGGTQPTRANRAPMVWNC